MPCPTNHLTVGYKLVIAESFTQRSSVLALALQRIMHSLFASLVRACQLYYPTSPNLWFELHQVYLLARKTICIRSKFAMTYSIPLQNKTWKPHTQLCSITKLLTHQSNASKRHCHLSQCAAKLVPSRDHTKCRLTQQKHVFVVNLHSDAPPRYKELMAEANGQALPVLTHKT